MRVLNNIHAAIDERRHPRATTLDVLVDQRRYAFGWIFYDGTLIGNGV